jgi:streptogramin lyase
MDVVADLGRSLPVLDERGEHLLDVGSLLLVDLDGGVVDDEFPADQFCALGCSWFDLVAGWAAVEADECFELVAPVRGCGQAQQGTRRVWADSQGKLWTSQWSAGQVAVYEPGAQRWREWRLPGDAPQAYAVYVDEEDRVWLSDFGANALVEFDPATEEFTSYPLPGDPGEVRQIHGRPGEIWGAESAVDKLVVIRSR